MGYKFFLLIFAFGVNAYAETSADRYCAFLMQLTDQAQRAALPTDVDAARLRLELLSMVYTAPDFAQEEDIALVEHQTFEDFQSLLKKKKIMLSNLYRPVYLGRYMRQSCGQIQVKFAADGKSQTSAENQFDPTGYAYFQQMPK